MRCCCFAPSSSRNSTPITRLICNFSVLEPRHRGSRGSQDRLRSTSDRAPDSFAAEVALFATVNGTGVRSLDLVNTWRKKTEIKVLPLHRGMLFKAVGRQWQVLWPPRELYQQQLAALANGAARDVEQLAETLAVAGDSTFKDNLEAARESALPSDAPEEGVGAWYEPDGVSPLPTLDDINNDIEEEEPAAVIRSHQRGSRTSGRSQGSIVEFARVSWRLARANHNLSLIVYDREQHLITYGDAKESVLRLALVGSPSHFCVALAPHHGTAPVPELAFPTAAACVSQAGEHGRQRWYRHLESHGQERSCVNTADVRTVGCW